MKAKNCKKVKSISQIKKCGSYAEKKTELMKQKQKKKNRFAPTCISEAVTHYCCTFTFPLTIHKVTSNKSRKKNENKKIRLKFKTVMKIKSNN